MPRMPKYLKEEWAFFLDELKLSAEDAFSASAPRMGRPNAREEAATDFIRSLLAGGRRLASDCEATLEAAGFKKSTYKKSKKKAGVRSVKDGFLCYWTLPEVEKPIGNAPISFPRLYFVPTTLRPRCALYFESASFSRRTSLPAQ